MGISNLSTGEQLSLWTSSAEATPANLSAPQGKDEEPTTLDTCGRGCETPLAHYDLATRSWKTYGDTSLLGEQPSLGSLPKSGIARSGELYLRPVWVRPIDEIASLSWPTPTAVTRPMEGNVRLYRAKIAAGEMTEEEAEQILGKSPYEAQGKIPRQWPTPTTQENEHPNAVWNEQGRRTSPGGTSHAMNLADAVQFWPTPTADDASNVNPKPNRFRGLVAAVNESLWPTPTANSWSSTGHRQILQNRITDGTISETERLGMVSGNGGKLNPTWVEWLMGFPTGWTDLKD